MRIGYVLREENIDSRKVIINEKAPLYHVGDAKEYVPMLFIVSDNDMKNRYEQTMVLISTLEHFEYDLDKIILKVMNGGHCHYTAQVDDNGNSIFGKMIYDFITKT